MRFANPEFLALLALVPLLAAWEFRRARRERAGLRISSVQTVRAVPRTIWARLRGLPALLRLAALALGIFALARPQSSSASRERYAEGVDIMLVLDVSTSMRAQDFNPDRFRAAKAVGSEFIRSRFSDRVGLIVFAGKAFTQAPLTLDYDFLERMLAGVEMGRVEDGTAIGTALAMAVNRLKDSEAASKVIILLTDGQNNRGEVDPVTAAEVAAAIGVRVYAIGVGTHGTAPYPTDHPLFGQRLVQVPVEIDEEMLRTVARTTGGQYFRATSKDALRSIYSEIGTLEKTKIEERIYTDYEERYPIFLWPALALVLLELALSSTRLRRLP